VSGPGHYGDPAAYASTEAGLPDIEDLTMGGPPASQADVRDAVYRSLGGELAPAPRPSALPDISGLREALGWELAP